MGVLLLAHLACSRVQAPTPNASPEGDTLLVPANPGRGWYWPFRLYVPPGKGPLRLLVLPNNTGRPDDDASVHDRAAEELFRRNRRTAVDLNTALLVPSFPRPQQQWRVYTHALDRDTLLAPPPLGGLDRQLASMIGAANGELRRRGRGACDRVFLIGFSAAGMFVNRFSLLHPEKVQAAVAGSPGGWPMVPVAADGGELLPYPVGVEDYPTMTGHAFPAGVVRAVPLLFVLGDRDTNDAVAYRDAFDEQQAALINRRFGETMVERWAHARRLFAGFSADFRLYPGIGHTWSAEMIADILAFLRGHDDRQACQR